MTVVSDFHALLSGNSWVGAAGQGTILTYSFSTAPTATLQANNTAAASFQPLTATQRATVRAALAQWAAISGITLYETTATPGDITFGLYDFNTIPGASGSVGQGNFPSTGTTLDSSNKPQIYNNFLTEGGDVYFDSTYAANPANATDFAHVAIHEIGHALGLKHPFDTYSPGGTDTLAAALDNGSETVMSYNGTRSATLGPLDTAAMQYLYGTKTTASHPVAQTWNPTTESLTETGTTTAQQMFGSGGNDVFYSMGARDAISGGEGNDIVYAAAAPIGVNGGPGTDTVVTGLTYTTQTTIGGSAIDFRYIYLPSYNDFQSYSNVELLDFTNGVYATTTNTFQSFDTITSPGTTNPDLYTWSGGPNANWGDASHWTDTSYPMTLLPPGANDQVSVTGGTASAPTAITGIGNAATFTATAGSVSLLGTFVFSSLTLQQAATLSIGPTASLEIGPTGATTAPTSGAITIDPGHTLSGAGTISAPIVDNGTILATGGTLTLAAPSGSGTLQLGTNATLILSGRLQQTTTFIGAAAYLVLQATGSATPPPAPIAGFAPGDTIEVTAAGPGPAQLAFAAGVLTLTIAGAPATALTLSGYYGSSTFAAAATATPGTYDITVQSDPLFDAPYYLAHNPDVAAAGVDPYTHYMTTGWKEGRNPDAWFDTRYYLAQNPDIAAAGINPLTHFETTGWHEARQPSLLFSDTAYLAQNPDVAAANIDPLAHFIAHGQSEGRQPILPNFDGTLSAADPMVSAAYLDAQLGATLIPPGTAAQAQAAETYANTGWKHALNPNPWFDTTYYLTQNPDVAAAGIDPLQHFETHGWKEGRDPSLVFSDSKYLAANPDVKAAAIDPLTHYITNGQSEDRPSFLTGGALPADPLVSAAYYDAQLGATIQPSGTAAAQQAAWSYDNSGWQKGLNPDTWFNTTYYLTHNPDVAAAHIDPLLHYETNGWKEGRDPSAQFSTTKYLAAYADVKAAGFDPLLHYIQSGQYEGRTAFTV